MSNLDDIILKIKELGEIIISPIHTDLEENTLYFEVMGDDEMTYTVKICKK